jgi:cell division protein FtsZ
MGDALMGTGIASGENRAALAADTAIHSPLLDDISIAGARGILINITGGEDMTLYDVSDATQAVQDAVGEDSETNIIFGAVIDPAMKDKIQVTVIATGFNEEHTRKAPAPTTVAVSKPSLKTAPAEEVKASESKVEQMAINLAVKSHEASRQPEPVAPVKMHVESEVYHEPETKAIPIIESKPELKVVRAPAPEPVVQAHRVAAEPPKAEAAPMQEFPVVFRRENVQKEQIFVSKGQVITHYEDDMDVPTFLRKQMQ